MGLRWHRDHVLVSLGDVADRASGIGQDYFPGAVNGPLDASREGSG
jgi:hypothetical protein